MPSRQSPAGVLAEFARAKLGQSRTPVETIAEWPAQFEDAFSRRERAYWVGLTLLARGKPTLAQSVAVRALSEDGVRGNVEQGWRLAAVARMAEQQDPSPAALSVTARSNTTAAELEKAWAAADATSYFSRLDLIELKKAIR